MRSVNGPRKELRWRLREAALRRFIASPALRQNLFSDVAHRTHRAVRSTCFARCRAARRHGFGCRRIVRAPSGSGRAPPTVFRPAPLAPPPESLRLRAESLWLRSAKHKDVRAEDARDR